MFSHQTKSVLEQQQVVEFDEQRKESLFSLHLNPDLSSLQNYPVLDQPVHDRMPIVDQPNQKPHLLDIARAEVHYPQFPLH